MNTFNDIENNIESDYSLEDSLLGVANDLHWKIQEIMRKSLLDSFTEFIENKILFLMKLKKN